MVEKYLKGEIADTPARKAVEQRVLEGNLMSRVKTD